MKKNSKKSWKPIEQQLADTYAKHIEKEIPLGSDNKKKDESQNKHVL
jgi:hypothetical protein